MSRAQQRALVRASAGGSVMARCQAVDLARSTYYYPLVGESALNLNLQLMRLLNEEYTRHSFKGVLGMRDHVRLHGYAVNEKRVRRLLRLMGLEAVYPKPRLSAPGQGVTHYPYLLRERVITAPNEVWSTDITYIPMARGFLYLVAVLNWHSRYVLSWELSNTLDVGFCLTALADALRQQPAPYLFHSETMPSSSTRAARRRHCRWRGPGQDGQHLYLQLKAYFTYYNHQRPHQMLKGQTPTTIYTQTPTFKLQPSCLITPV